MQPLIIQRMETKNSPKGYSWAYNRSISELKRNVVSDKDPQRGSLICILNLIVTLFIWRRAVMVWC